MFIGITHLIPILGTEEELEVYTALTEQIRSCQGIPASLILKPRTEKSSTLSRRTLPSEFI